ncbi:MAG: hypothetical protein ACRDOJ_01960 [Nocardioidaceae bacterium]
METKMLWMPHAARLRMPAGASTRRDALCADVELGYQGTSAFGADTPAIAARNDVFDVPGVRSWSPPV